MGIIIKASKDGHKETKEELETAAEEEAFAKKINATIEENREQKKHIVELEIKLAEAAQQWDDWRRAATIHEKSNAELIGAIKKLLEKYEIR